MQVPRIGALSEASSRNTHSIPRPQGGIQPPRRVVGWALRSPETGEGVRDIRYQVLRILDPKGQANQAISNARLLALLPRQHGMRGQARNRNQRLHTPQAGRDAKELEAIDEAFCRLQRSLKLQTHYTAATLHLTSSELMLGMTLQHRIEDASHPSMTTKGTGDR